MTVKPWCKVYTWTSDHQLKQEFDFSPAYIMPLGASISFVRDIQYVDHRGSGEMSDGGDNHLRFFSSL